MVNKHRVTITAVMEIHDENRCRFTRVRYYVLYSEKRKTKPNIRPTKLWDEKADREARTRRKPN